MLDSTGACDLAAGAPKASWGDEEPLFRRGAASGCGTFGHARGVGVGPTMPMSTSRTPTSPRQLLATGDIDGEDADLLVVRPSSAGRRAPAIERIQRGAFYAVKARASGMKQELTWTWMPTSRSRPVACDFFGQALAVATVGGRGRRWWRAWHRNRNGSTAGAVYLFALHNSGGVLSASLADHRGDTLAELGHAVGGHAARARVTGSGRKRRRVAWRRGAADPSRPHATPTGPSAERAVGNCGAGGTAAAGSASPLGRALAWVDGGLVVAAPLATTATREGGAVFAWPAASPPTGAADDARASEARSVRGRTRGRLGAALAAGRGRLASRAAGDVGGRDGGGGGGLRDRATDNWRDTRRTG